MNRIELNDFIKLFGSKRGSLNDFINKAKVSDNHGSLTPLKSYLETKKITKDDIAMLYSVVVENKNAYLTSFYNTSLSIDDNALLQDEEPMKAMFKNTLKPKYKNLIRNMHYREILLETTTELGHLKPYLQVSIDLFKHWRIDYKLLTPSGIHFISTGHFANIMSGFYFRASIMNPYLVYSLNKTKLHGTKIFTPTLGWSSYLYGFLSSNVETYVGIDVIPKVCSKTLKLAESLINKHDYTTQVSIYCNPSEDLLHNATFINKYRKTFDTIFFSPPYYKLELYKGGQQSTSRYSTYEEWLEGYWEQTIKLCSIVAAPNCQICYIISGYDKYTSMVNDMNSITKKYFKYKSSIAFGNSNVQNTTHRDTQERIYFFTM